MKTKCFLGLMALLCTLSLPGKAGEPVAKNRTDANIYGHVVQAKDNEHLAYVTVSVRGTTLTTATDATGHYYLKDLPVGKHTVEAKALGYRTATHEIEISANSSQEVNFTLTEDAIALDEVVLTANRSQTLRREAPALVNVLDSKLFDQTNAMCMAQGLNFQPGVRTENNCQNCGFSQVRINGLDGQGTYAQFCRSEPHNDVHRRKGRHGE